MAKSFKIGDHVSWNSEAGRVSGTIIARENPSLRMFPLPHPSWHNTRWLTCNPWFETDMLPVLREDIRNALS